MTRRRCRGASRGPRRTPGAVLLGFGMARGGVTSVGAASLRLPEASVAEAPGRPGTCRDRAGVRKTFLIFLPPSLVSPPPSPHPQPLGEGCVPGPVSAGSRGKGRVSVPSSWGPSRIPLVLPDMPTGTCPRLWLVLAALVILSINIRMTISTCSQ